MKEIGVDRNSSAAVAVAEADEGDNRRVATRTNLLLAASIEAGALNAPIRIRNLSETGAAIEGPALPRAGTPVILRRLDLAIGGVVVWTEGARCGVRFHGRTCVPEWIAGSRPAPGGVRDQARVDSIQAVVRTGSGHLPPSPPVLRAVDGPALDSRVAEEIGFVRRLLEQLGDALAEDPVILRRHARSLQDFDLAGQILGHVASVLVADDRSAAVAAIGMDDLRARLLRKPVGG